MEERTYSAVIHQEGPLYVAECPEVGTVSQGESIDEALRNLTEATELYVEEFPATDHPKSFLTTFQIKVGAHA